MNDNGWCRVFLLGSAALTCSACAPANEEVGSACKNGVCSEALATQGPVCLVSGQEAELGFDSDLSPGQVCLPHTLASNNGMARCNVYWDLTHVSVDPPVNCSDRPFLAPTSDPKRCLLHQVAAPAHGATSEEGWYVDEQPDPPCADGLPYALHITQGARAPDGVPVTIDCLSILSPSKQGTLELSDAAECKLTANNKQHADAVGDACQPLVPEGGFDDRSAYVETGAKECGTGVCLVFHLSGDPSASCGTDDAGDPACASPAEVDKRVYCSCRCDAPEGQPDACKCGKGFDCIAVLGDTDAPEAVSGSYCVRDHT